MLNNEQLETLSNEELLELYEEKKKSVEKVWRNSSDGNYEAEYYMEVYPIEKLLKERGLL